jgi:hypothetical protein
MHGGMCENDILYCALWSINWFFNGLRSKNGTQFFWTGALFFRNFIVFP